MHGTNSNKFPILGGLFQTNVDCQNNHFARVKTKRNEWYEKSQIFIFDNLERNSFEK